MELQKIFDTVVQHLRQQKKKSIDSRHTYCRYRGPGGSMCAAGCLIPDSAYRPEMEGKTIEALLDKEMYPECYCRQLVVKLNTPEKVSLVGRMQTIHDGTPAGLRGQSLLDLWEKRFQIVATEFGLTYNPPLPSKSKNPVKIKRK